jgi:N-acetyl-anhydromuramyl-L-alanine amidase AmpD
MFMHYILAVLYIGVLPQTYTPTVVVKPFPQYMRRDTTQNYVVIHYDDGIEPRATLQWLRRKRNSYHYFILRDGTIYKLVDPKYQANHAGWSLWDRRVGLNRYSIGVSLQNDSEQLYTEKQYQSLNWLLNILKKRFPDITYDRIIGHSDVAWPRGRKQDPGEQFDWSRIKPEWMLHVTGTPQLAPYRDTSRDPIPLRLIFPIYDVGKLPSSMETSIRRRP